MKRRAAGSPAALVIIIVILIGIIAYFAILPGPYKRELLQGPPAVEYNNVVLDASPGKLTTVKEDVVLEKISLPTVLVDNTPQTHRLMLIDQLLVKKGLFQDVYGDYNFDVNTDTFSAARLHFVVTDKEGGGILTVSINEHTIFSRGLGIGETLDIDLPKYYLREGTNTLRISVTGSSLQTSSYLLSYVSLDMDNYLGELADQSFPITEDTAKALDEATFTARAERLEKSVNLILELNGEEIFNALPTTNLRIDLPTNLLKTRYNTLSWSTDRDGKYSLKHSIITLEEIEVEEGGKRYYFTIDEDDIYFARQDKKYDCELYILKRSGEDEIMVTINAVAKQHVFENGEVRADVCSALREGTNKLVLSVEDDTVISDLTLTIKNKN